MQLLEYVAVHKDGEEKGVRMVRYGTFYSVEIKEFYVRSTSL